MKFLIIMAICLLGIFAGSFLIAASMVNAAGFHLMVLGYLIAIFGCIAFGAKVLIHLPHRTVEG